MDENDMKPSIGDGAVVEATDGLVGTVIRLESDPQTNQLLNLIVANSGNDKEFTIPARLIASTIGTQVVHLNVSKDELLNNGVEMKIDSNTGNFGHPTPPMPQ